MQQQKKIDNIFRLPVDDHIITDEVNRNIWFIAMTVRAEVELNRRALVKLDQPVLAERQISPNNRTLIASSTRETWWKYNNL